VNFRSTLSSLRKTASSTGFQLSLQTLLLIGVLVMSVFNVKVTTDQGSAHTHVLQTQADAISAQTELLREIVTGQQSTAKALLDGATGGGQIKVTTWKYRDPRTGACVTFQVTTSQAQGESFEDFQARHFLAVRTDEALMPPDPSCP
jgi:hypothetical protein